MALGQFGGDCIKGMPRRLSGPMQNVAPIICYERGHCYWVGVVCGTYLFLLLWLFAVPGVRGRHGHDSWFKARKREKFIQSSHVN